MTPPIPFADYQRLAGVNWSTLSYMQTSPLAYRENLLNPKPSTAAMDLGSAMHAIVLEPETFFATYGMFEGRRGTKAHQEWQEEHPGMSDLKPDDWERCLGVAEAVTSLRQGKQARRLLRGTQREVSLRWIDPDTHIRCKARPDIVRYTRERTASWARGCSPT